MTGSLRRGEGKKRSKNGKEGVVKDEAAHSGPPEKGKTGNFSGALFF